MFKMETLTASLTSIIRKRLNSLHFTRDARPAAAAALDPAAFSSALLDSLYVGLFKSICETITSPIQGSL